MSFSREVKDELARQFSRSRHCQLAEIAAIVSLCGHITISGNDQYTIRISTENISVARKYFTLLKKTFNIDTDISIRQNAYLKKGRTYTVVVKNHEDARKVIRSIKLLDPDGMIRENLSLRDNTIIMKDCCKRTFLRGAFLAAGSITNPQHSYHLEIVCATRDKAVQVQGIMTHFQLEAKIIGRSQHYVVYLKEGEQISQMLCIMEAHVAMMQFENIRILKDMRNTVNRKVNCETANLNKTAQTAYRQIEDIRLLEQHGKLSSLPDSLVQTAQIRLAHPDASLQELGTLLTPSVGKSGVNHRLRKLGEIAQEFRDSQGTDSQ